MNIRLYIVMGLVVASAWHATEARAITLTLPSDSTETTVQEPAEALLRYVSKADISRRNDEVAADKKRSEWEQQRQKESARDTSVARMHGDTNLESIVVLGRQFKLSDRERTDLQLAANSPTGGFNLLGLVALAVDKLIKKGHKSKTKKEKKMEKLRSRLSEL